MPSQIPDKKDITVHRCRMLSNMVCLPDLLEKHAKPGHTQSSFKKPKDCHTNSYKNSFSSPVKCNLSNWKSILSVSTAYTLISKQHWFMTVKIKKGKGQNSLTNHHSFSATVTATVTKGCFFHHTNIPTDIKYPEVVSVESWSPHTSFWPETKTNSTI